MQDFEHRRARHARDEADLDDGERQGRHDDLASPTEWIFAEGHVAAGRKEAEFDRKQQDQHDAEPEIRNGQSNQASGHDDLIGPAVVIDGSDNAGRDAR